MDLNDAPPPTRRQQSCTTATLRTNERNVMTAWGANAVRKILLIRQEGKLSDEGHQQRYAKKHEGVQTPIAPSAARSPFGQKTLWPGQQRHKLTRIGRQELQDGV